MRIPGLVSTAGGFTKASDAASYCYSLLGRGQTGFLLMPLVEDVLAFVIVVDRAGDSCAEVGSSCLMVEVEVDRPKLFKGERWVSLSSIQGQ